MSRLNISGGYLFVIVVFLVPQVAHGWNKKVEVRECRLHALPVEKDFLYKPTDIDASNEKIFVADKGNNRIVALDYSGKVIQVYGGAGSNVGEYISPQSLCVSAGGQVYIADVGNKRVTSVGADGSGSKIVESGFYVFDVSANSGALLYTGKREAAGDLLFLRDAEGRTSGFSQPWVIDHEFKSVFRNANTVKIHCSESLVVIGFPALATVRICSISGETVAEFFIGGDEVNYIRHEAWNKMLTGVDAGVLKERQSIVTADQKDIIDDFLALARPNRFSFPSYIADLKLWNDRLFVLVGERILEYSLDGKLLQKYTFLDEDNSHVYLFSFDIDESGKLWGADGVHTYGIYYTDTAGWQN